MQNSNDLSSSGLRFRGSGPVERDDETITDNEPVENGSPLRHMRKLGEHLRILEKQKTQGVLRPSERKAFLSEVQKSAKKGDGDDGIETIAVEAHDVPDDHDYISRGQMVEEEEK